MKSYFNYDFINKAITGSQTAIRKANAGNTPEYRELSAKLAEHPDFKIIPKEIKANSDKKKYNGLTFERMKEYILLQPDSENRIIEFEAIVSIADAKGAKYPLTKKWFLAKYTEYKANDVQSNDEALKKATAEIEAIKNNTKKDSVE